VSLYRWVRVVLVSATALAAWLVVAPGRALAAEPPPMSLAQPVEPPLAPGAPVVAALCDDRGATVIAPAPLLQGPDSTVEVDDDARDECSWRESSAKTFSPQPADGSSDSPSSDAGVAVLSIVVPTVVAIDRLVPFPPPELSAPPRGVRIRVERPPRA
jgi:hypothetical protein